jgi:putative transposase
MKELIGIMSVSSGDHKLSISRKCELLEVPRSSFYYDEQPESQENLHLMELMDKRHLDHPTHGVLQMQDYLFLLGFMVNHKRVRRLLRKMGVMARYPRRNLSKLGHAKYIRPYLLRNLEISRPNKVWAIDITYLPMKRGFMYLTAIIDVYSRFVVGWDISNSLDAANSLEVLKCAIARYGEPEIVNSDQGSQFTCSLWIEYLEKEGIQISMDGKGRAIDNIFIERLWRTVKQDYVYQYPAEDGTELYQGLKKFFQFYNHEKSHQGIDRERPISLYKPAA